MHHILTIALNPALDINTAVQALQPDKKLRCAVPNIEAGGGAVNVARVILLLGGRAELVYFAGGFNGRRLTSLLKMEGIAGFPIRINGETRENVNVQDRSCDRQYRFILPGPAVLEAECQRMLDVVKKRGVRAGYFVISGSFPPGITAGFLQELKEIAADVGARIIADTSGDALKEIVRSGVYLIKPNIGELAVLSGCARLSEAEAVGAAREVITAGGCEVAVVSLGEAGALLVTADLSERIPAPVVKRVSTVGAGDSMVAGIVFGLQKGMPLREAVRLGIACGTAATLNPGTAVCKKGDVERLYSSIRSEIHFSLPGLNIDEQFL